MSEKMSAGDYIIGDPCYVIPENDWDKFCNMPEGEVFELELSTGQKITCWYFSTYYGDGTYDADSYLGNHKLGVDSGCIGIIQTFPDAKCLREGYSELVVKYSPKKSFSVECEDGVFNIGPWNIDTGDSGESGYADADWDYQFDDDGEIIDG